MIATENALYESDAETITPIEVKLAEPTEIVHPPKIGGLYWCDGCASVRPVGHVCIRGGLDND